LENGIIQAVAAGGFFTIDWLQGSPITLVLAIACFAGGIWYVYHERKTKSKEQRVQEQKQLSKRFMDNINRNQSYIEDEGMVIRRNAEEGTEQKASLKAQGKSQHKKR